MLLENGTTEFKREYKADITKTIISFANTNGGTIYVGVEDDGSVCGVDDIDDTLLKIGNSVRDSIKPDITLFIEYKLESLDGKNIIVIEIQKGTACPYYLAAKGIRPEGIYVRQGASTVPATETAILKMIKETDGAQYEDMRSLNQSLTFMEAEKEFKKMKVPFGNGQKKTLGLINAEGIYTNLALLLSDQCAHTIKVAVFEGRTKAQFQDRREFSGSLLKQLNDAFEFLSRYNRNRAKIEGLYRQDQRDYPSEALREALLNALVHREYSYSDSTLISIFDDKMEFVSIGGLVRGITLEDVMLGISVVRNKHLADIFYRLTLIEAYGTGMPQIINSYEEYELRPKIEVTNNAFKITLPNISKSPAEGGKEEMVMRMLEGKESITRKEVEKALDISQALAGRILKNMSDKEMIRAVGNGKSRRYIGI